MDIFKTVNMYHIGIAVYDAEKTAKLYVDTLGLKIEHDETSVDQGVRAIMLVPENASLTTAIELLEPVVDDSIKPFPNIKEVVLSELVSIINLFDAFI